MAPNDWNDEKVISSLKEMPKIEDKRSKDEIYQNISGQLIDSQDKKRNWKRHFKILPSLATVAVFAILLLIIPPFFQEKSTPKIADKDEPQMRLFSGLEKQEHQYIGSLQDIPENKEILTMYYPDQAGRFLVPLTFPVEKKGKKAKFEQMENIINSFDHGKVGLADSYLKEVELKGTDEPNTALVDIPENYFNKMGGGTASERLLYETVNRTLSDLGYSKVRFMTEGLLGVQFPHYGEKSEENIQKFNPIGFIPFTTATGYILLYSIEYPSEAVDINNVGELLQGAELELSPNPILSEAQYTVKHENDKDLLVVFKNKQKLENNAENLALLDSILLTAKQYNFKRVAFDGIVSKQVGPYQLTDPIEVPFGPNYIILDLMNSGLGQAEKPMIDGDKNAYQILLNPLAINNITTGDSYKKVLAQFGEPIRFEDNKEGVRLLYYSKKGAGIKVEVDLQNELLQSISIYPAYLDDSKFSAVPRQKGDIIDTFGPPSEQTDTLLKYYQKDPKKTMEVKLKSDETTVELIEIKEE